MGLEGKRGSGESAILRVMELEWPLVVIGRWVDLGVKKYRGDG